MKLHEIERRRLAKTGCTVLWRPIEPQPQTVRLDTSTDPPTWYANGGIIEAGHPLRQRRPGDVISTDSGAIVRIVSVGAEKIVAMLSDDERWCWRVEVEVVPKRK